jgi:hypothetical protein
VLDSLRHGSNVRAVLETMRDVNLKPDDDVRAMGEMEAARADLI